MDDTPQPDEKHPFEKWWDRFAYVFNRTALGMGVLVGGYSLYQGAYVRAILLFALIPYFYLKDRYDAP